MVFTWICVMFVLVYLSLCHPCYHSCSNRLYWVTTHKNYIALVLCEVGNVNLLNILGFKKSLLRGKYKTINWSSYELDRQSFIYVTNISIKCICCKQIKPPKINKYDVAQYLCIRSTYLKVFASRQQSKCLCWYFGQHR